MYLDEELPKDKLHEVCTWIYKLKPEITPVEMEIKAEALKQYRCNFD